MRDPLRERIIEEEIRKYSESINHAKVDTSFLGILWSIFTILLAVVFLSAPLIYVGFKMVNLDVNQELIVRMTLFGQFFISAFLMFYLMEKIGKLGGIILGPLIPFAFVWASFHFNKSSSELPFFIKFFANCAVISMGLLTHMFLPQMRKINPWFSRVLYWKVDRTDSYASPIILFLAGIGFRELLEARGFSLMQTEIVILTMTCLSIYTFTISLSWNAAENQIITAIPYTLFGIYLFVFFDPESINAVMNFFKPVTGYFIILGLLSGCGFILGRGGSSSDNSGGSHEGGGGGFSGGGASGRW